MRRRILLEDTSDSEFHPYVEIAGIKWAKTNIGAETETDYGLYFAWGETTGYPDASSGKSFTWSNYQLCNGSNTTLTKYNNKSSYGTVDNKTVLEAVDDAATANWGGNWRMPTTEEFIALRNATTTRWVTDYNGSGINGRLVTDKTDSSKTLFFPAAGYCGSGSVYGSGSSGYYWSSSLYSSNARIAYSLDFSSSYVNWQNNYYGYRYGGFSVRPVLDE